MLKSHIDVWKKYFNAFDVDDESGSTRVGREVPVPIISMGFPNKINSI